MSEHPYPAEPVPDPPAGRSPDAPDWLAPDELARDHADPAAVAPPAGDAPSGGPAAWVLEGVRRTALAAASGVLAGLSGYAFLRALAWATETRLAHGWLLWLLPLAGLAVGGAYHLFGGRAGEGNALLLAEIHEPTAWVPRRMAPLVAVGTVVSHLFGASVGREGTALQMSGSLTDGLARVLGLRAADRRWLLVAALAGGFGAVFGLPWAGAVFALEVQSVRRGHLARAGMAVRRLTGRAAGDAPGAARPPAPVLRSDRRSVATLAVLAGPALVAALVGDAVVGLLGHEHAEPLRFAARLTPMLLVRTSVIGLVCGLAAFAFVELHGAIHHAARRLPWPPLRPVVGGLLVIAIAVVAGRDELGLSLPLLDQALAGHHTALSEPVLKLVLTALCLGTGFVGGEVTPLFVIGATLGSALAPTVGLDPATGAALGFAACFAGAANTPIACTVLAVEVFGPGVAVPGAVACAAAYLASGGRGIYGTQRIGGRDGVGLAGERPSLARRARQARDRSTVPPP